MSVSTQRCRPPRSNTREAATRGVPGLSLDVPLLMMVVYWRVVLSFVMGRTRAFGREDSLANELDDESEKMKRRRRAQKMIGEEAIGDDDDDEEWCVCECVTVCIFIGKK